MKNKYKILVTGVAGFLGSHLSEQLANLGHEVIGIDSMIGGYKDNIPNNIKFHHIDCCDFQKVKTVFEILISEASYLIDDKAYAVCECKPSKE